MSSPMGADHDHAKKLALDNLVGIDALHGLKLKAPMTHFARYHERGIVGRKLGKCSEHSHAFTCLDDSERVVTSLLRLVALRQEILSAVELLFETVWDSNDFWFWVCVLHVLLAP